MFSSTLSRVLALLAFIALTSGIAALGLSWRQQKRAQMRNAALLVTIQQAQPLIGAITKYSIQSGAPPETLELLVPKHLTRIPDAGPAARDGWIYKATTNEASGGWSLAIRVRDEYSPNISGFGDTFVFHPNARYPDLAYGGGRMPFGDGSWAYYVE